MSQAAINHATRDTDPKYFLLRRVHSLAGILFGGYICVHLLINATLIQGQKPYEGVAGGPRESIFQFQVDTIHSLPFLLAVELSLIFLPLLIHTFYGIFIMLNGRPNVGSYNYVKNWFYILQRVTAVLLVGFILFHVGGMYGWFGENLTFEPEGTAFESTIRHIQLNWFIACVVYPVGVIVGTFHLANGFWAAGVAWGLTVSKQSQARWGWICLLLFFFTTACGITAIVATFVYKNAALPNV